MRRVDKEEKGEENQVSEAKYFWDKDKPEEKWPRGRKRILQATCNEGWLAGVSTGRVRHTSTHLLHASMGRPSMASTGGASRGDHNSYSMLQTNFHGSESFNLSPLAAYCVVPSESP